MKRAVAAAIALSLPLFVPPPPAFAEEVKESYAIFGHLLDIRVEAIDRETAQNRIRDAVTVARRIEAQLDAADPASELARLNAGAGRDPIRISLDLYRLLALSQLMTRSTGDAFDVTVGPLLKRRHAATDRASRIDMDEALSLVGADGIVLRPPDKAALAGTGMSVDLSAIRRGYCLERMAAELREAGIDKALLEFGDSTVVAVGPPDDEPPFRVRVARGRSVAGTVALRDLAMSTTRARRRGEEEERPPIVDPRSGRLVDSDRQATAVARNAAIAEAWSTALVVDPDGARALLDEPRDVEALVYDEHGEHWSPRFATFASWRPSEAAVPAGRPESRPVTAGEARQAERAARRDERASERAAGEAARTVERGRDEPIPRDEAPANGAAAERAFERDAGDADPRSDATERGTGAADPVPAEPAPRPRADAREAPAAEPGSEQPAREP